MQLPGLVPFEGSPAPAPELDEAAARRGMGSDGTGGWASRCGPSPGSGGFTLVAVVAIIAVMAIMLTVAVQTASFHARREREAELIFRGQQIVEAIRLFRARNGRFPGSLIELAQADPRVTRKVWKDPVTGGADWVPIFLGQEGTTVGAPGQGAPTPAPTPGPTPRPGPAAFPPTEATGPVVGVHSRSCAKSIKVVDGRDRYCDWKFVYDPQKAAPPRNPGGS